MSTGHPSGLGVQLYRVSCRARKTVRCCLINRPVCLVRGRHRFPPLVPVEFNVEKAGGHREREDRPARRRKLLCFSRFQRDLNVL